MPTLSVIVPVYKVEQYLAECVDSILNQTYQDYELILIDDGSPDGCGALCDEYAKKDNRIRVIHKKNGGVSSARNIALDLMKGKYVTFIDADDWVSPILFETLVSPVLKCLAEISICNLRSVFKDRQEIPRTLPNDIVTNEIALRDLLYEKKFAGYLCGKLFVATLFSNVRLPLNIRMCEDGAILYRIFDLATTVAYCSSDLYYYRQRQSSAVNQTNDDDIKKIIAMEKEMCSFLRKNYPSLQTAINFRQLYILFKYHEFFKFSKEQNVQMNLIKNHLLFFMNNSQIDGKTKLKLLLFCFNRKFYFLIKTMFVRTKSIQFFE